MDDELVWWCGAQAAKIICRYYDCDSEIWRNNRQLPQNKEKIPLNVGEHLRKYFSEKAPSGIYDTTTLPELREKTQAMLDVFRRYIRQDTPIGKRLVPENIAPQIVSLALEKGYGLIYILDGCDRLEITSEAISRWDKIRASIGSEAFSHEAGGKVIVCVTRTNSIGELFGAGQVQAYRSGAGNAFSLAEVPLDKVLDRRFNLIKDEMKQLSSGKMDNQDWNAIDCDELLTSFRAFLYQVEDSAKYDGHFSERLGSILKASNRRSQMQLVQWKYWEFLESLNRHELRPYHLIEAIMKANCWFPPIYYSYARVAKGGNSDRDGKEIRCFLLAHEFSFDSKFLPSIFNFPRIARTKHSKEGAAIAEDVFRALKISKWEPFTGDWLLNLRIMQFVAAAERYIQLKQNRERPRVEDLVEICSRSFGYAKSKIACCIIELREYELIELKASLLSASARFGSQYVYSTPKMRVFLHKIIYDIAYLNLASMRMPLPVSSFAVEPPYFVAATLEDRGETGSFWRWIAAKICNSIGVVRIVRELNERQRREYLSNIRRLKKNQRHVELTEFAGKDIFEFVKKLEVGVSEQIGGLLRSLHDRPPPNVAVVLENVRTYFESYVRKWARDG